MALFVVASAVGLWLGFAAPSVSPVSPAKPAANPMSTAPAP